MVPFRTSQNVMERLHPLVRMMELDEPFLKKLGSTSPTEMKLSSAEDPTNGKLTIFYTTTEAL